MDKTVVPLSESVTTSAGHNIQGTGLRHKHAHTVDVTLQAHDERFGDDSLRHNSRACGMQQAGHDTMGGACGMQQVGRMGHNGGARGTQWRGTWDAMGWACGMQQAGHMGRDRRGMWDATVYV